MVTKKSTLVLILFLSLVSLTYSAEWQTNSQSNFNDGTYHQTFYNNSGFVQLNATYTPGNYTSEIFDAGSVSQWNNI